MKSVWEIPYSMEWIVWTVSIEYWWWKIHVKCQSTLGCFESDPNILELACSLPVFDVLYINFNEQKIFKIYFIKKYGSLHFPKWYKNHYNDPFKEWKYFDHMES